MAFTRDQIREAKDGSHWISFQPGTVPVETVVVRVRGPAIWVRIVIHKIPGSNPPVFHRPTTQLIRINDTASRALMDGDYRTKRVLPYGDGR